MAIGSGDQRVLMEELKRGAWIKPVHYTRRELEYVLGVGRTKIDEWMKADRLASYKIDGTVFVAADEVDRFVGQHRMNNNLGIAA